MIAACVCHAPVPLACVATAEQLARIDADVQAVILLSNVGNGQGYGTVTLHIANGKLCEWEVKATRRTA